MKIAQDAPLWERVPPSNDGDIELVVSHLTNELVCRSYGVILFASGDSPTLTKLGEVYPCASRLDRNIQEDAVSKTPELRQIYQNAPRLDIIHSH